MPKGFFKLILLAAVVGVIIIVLIHLLPYFVGVLALVGLAKLWQAFQERNGPPPSPPNRWP